MSFKYTCSLGPHCHSSYLLKCNSLKKESYPFDWIFTNYKIIKNIIEDNFNEFLNKMHYKSLNKYQACHTIYHDSMFWHHNPLLNEDHYEYFIRCVERFQNMIKSDESKLFLYLVKDVCEIDETTIENNMFELYETLNKYTTNFKLLVVIIHPHKSKHKYTLTNSNSNIDFLHVDVLSSSNGKEFINQLDNKYISIILNTKYKFDLKNM